MYKNRVNRECMVVCITVGLKYTNGVTMQSTECMHVRIQEIHEDSVLCMVE